MLIQQRSQTASLSKKRHLASADVFQPSKRVKRSAENFMELVEIPRTDSKAWGTEDMASIRAKLVEETTAANEQLLRSYHPGLAPFESVAVATEWNGAKIWIVLPVPGLTYETHAGGREIHIHQPQLAPQFMHLYLREIPDPKIERISPRKLLSAEDLNAIRRMFPSRDIEESWQHGLGTQFGGMRIGYDVAIHSPTRAVLQRGDAIADESELGAASAALGLKLVLPGGRSVITVPTHAFVKLNVGTNRMFARIASWIAYVKDALSRFKPVRRLVCEVATERLREPAENSPVGRNVWLARGDVLVGTITETYDPPVSRSIPFPYGFRHDLSLVSGDNLPDLATPVNVPKVCGWGSYSDALSGKPVFVTGFNVTTGNLRTSEGTFVSPKTQVAVATGSEYLWEKESCSSTTSILWRTKHDGDRTLGHSGSVLCEGKITDDVCRAVVFQNFEVPIRDRKQLLDDHVPIPFNHVEFPTLKGGFLLPSEIRESEIVCDGSEDANPHRTWPPKGSL